MWLPEENFYGNKRGDWRRQWLKCNMTLNKWCNWSSCTKLPLSTSWTHRLTAQWVIAFKRNSVVLGSNPNRANFLLPVQTIIKWWIPHVSHQSATLMWLTQENFDENKRGDWLRQLLKRNMTLHKRSCAKFALSTNTTHSLKVQWVRESEENPVVVSSNPSQANFYSHFKESLSGK